MTQPGFFSRRDRGFTLVEIAVVIVILGLLLTMLLGISSTMIAQQRREATRVRLIAVETALTLYASQNQRLPCPANGSLPSSDPTYGKEITTGAGAAIQCHIAGVANGQQFGVLPWATLGLSEADVTDGWGTRLTYRVASEFVRLPAMNFTSCDPAGADSTVYAPGTVAGYCNPACTTATFPGSCTPPTLAINTRGLEIRNLAGAKIMDPALNTGAAYVVISHGENRAGGYSNESVVQAATGPASGTEETKNAANLPLQPYYVDDFAVYLDGTGHFDDFLIRPTILTVASRAQLGPRAH
jgi:prepilin-type N-terminal cleavage/methylation domain-containing protein